MAQRYLRDDEADTSKQVFIMDSSVMAADPHQRIVDKFYSLSELRNSWMVSTLADPKFIQEIMDWAIFAQVGDYKDFDVFSIFVAREG